MLARSSSSAQVTGRPRADDHDLTTDPQALAGTRPPPTVTWLDFVGGGNPPTLPAASVYNRHHCHIRFRSLRARGYARRGSRSPVPQTALRGDTISLDSPLEREARVEPRHQRQRRAHRHRGVEPAGEPENVEQRQPSSPRRRGRSGSGCGRSPSALPASPAWVGSAPLGWPWCPRCAGSPRCRHRPAPRARPARADRRAAGPGRRRPPATAVPAPRRPPRGPNVIGRGGGAHSPRSLGREPMRVFGLRPHRNRSTPTILISSGHQNPFIGTVRPAVARCRRTGLSPPDRAGRREGCVSNSNI